MLTAEAGTEDITISTCVQTMQPEGWLHEVQGNKQGVALFNKKLNSHRC